MLAKNTRFPHVQASAETGRWNSTFTDSQWATLTGTRTQVGFTPIDASRSGGYLVFGKKTLVDPVALVRLVQNDSHTYRMQGAERLQFRLELPEDDDRFTFVEQLLQELSTDPASARRLAS